MYTKQETKQKKAIIIKKRREGETLLGCAIYSGIGETTLHAWQKDDESFRSELLRARRDYRNELLVKTKDKKPEYLLERQFRDEFYIDTSEKTQTVNIFGNVTMAKLQGMSDEELKQAIDGELAPDPEQLQERVDR